MKNERRGGSLTDKLRNGHLDWSGPLGRGSSYSGQMLVGIYSTFLLHFHPDAPLKFIHFFSVRHHTALDHTSPWRLLNLWTRSFSICFCLLFYEWNIFEYILFEYITFFFSDDKAVFQQLIRLCHNILHDFPSIYVFICIELFRNCHDQ